MSVRRIGAFGRIPDIGPPDLREEPSLGRARGAVVRPPTIFKRPPIPSYTEDPLERAAAGAPEFLSQPAAIWFMALRRAGFEPHVEVTWRGGDMVVGGATLDVVIFRWDRRFVFRIQSYWHDPNFFPTRWMMDDIQRRELELEGWEVRDVWDWEINLAVYEGTLDSLVWSVVSGIRGA